MLKRSYLIIVEERKSNQVVMFSSLSDRKMPIQASDVAVEDFHLTLTWPSINKNGVDFLLEWVFVGGALPVMNEIHAHSMIKWHKQSEKPHYKLSVKVYVHQQTRFYNRR